MPLEKLCKNYLWRSDSKCKQENIIMKVFNGWYKNVYKKTHKGE